MKKVQLERILQSLNPIPEPKPDAEQYATPAGIAAEVVYLAHGKGDIANRLVLDLGCGNGVLAIGAALLGASRTVGVDNDRAAIETARTNAVRAKVDVEWRLADVGSVREAVDTVLMNPPFGAQTKHADRPFLEAALNSGRVVYTFMNSKAEDFVRRYAESAGAHISDRQTYAFPIRRAFEFHREDVRRIDVLLYRIEVAKG